MTHIIEKIIDGYTKEKQTLAEALIQINLSQRFIERDESIVARIEEIDEILKTIVDRYQSELDQPINSIFKE